MRYNEPYKELKELFKEPMFDEATKYTKEFIQDSLIFRFKEQQHLALNEIINRYYAETCDKVEAKRRATNIQERDLMRFIQILDLLFVERDNK